MKNFMGLRILLLTVLISFPVVTFVGCGGPPESVETPPELDPTLQGDDSTNSTGAPDTSLDPTLGGG
jgi:hypothetical protein